MTNKEIQTYLNKIGINCGAVDGICGPKTIAAIKKFQTAYGLDVDGIVGPITTKAMQRKDKVDWDDIKYFDKSEFKCQCDGYCKGSGHYPAPMDAKLINILDKLRAYIGKPIEVTSGLRCWYHNAEVGGVSNSKHQSGHAADISWSGIDNASKQKMIKKAYELGADYAYTNDSNMYGAIHVDVKR